MALGVGAGDVASIVGLGKRLGNWWSAISGDQEFLDLLETDDFEILKRRGIVDLPLFNKRWRGHMRLLANGKPVVFEDQDAKKVLNDFSRFTAIMVCVVASLDTFTTGSISKSILKAVLKELLRATEFGENLLETQYSHRLNAWRSLACLRGVTNEAEKYRQHLLGRNSIWDGLMPSGESVLMKDFLIWLLSGQTDSFITSSSDVAAVGLCLSSLGIDILSVSGPGFAPQNVVTPCQLIYSKDNILKANTNVEKPYRTLFERPLSTTVPLLHPEESIVHYPTSLDMHNQCRHAWNAGRKAASKLGLGVARTEAAFQTKGGVLQDKGELYYAFINRGSESQRVGAEMQEIAVSHSFVVNEELLLELEGCLRRQSPQVLAWLNEQTLYNNKNKEISDPDFHDNEKINAFCIFQSFFMAYYYHLFIKILDTSSLQVKSVRGEWGFRSVEFLIYMRNMVISRNTRGERYLTLTR